MANMKVLECNCKHDYQDASLGQNKRWHTIGKESTEYPVYRCTVCGNSKDSKDVKKK